MVIGMKPSRGGFMRAFGCGEFIRDFLMGAGPYGSIEIDPNTGACQEDIFYYYKLARHLSYAESAVSKEQEARAKKGLPLYTDIEYEERIDWILRRIPYKLVKCRYHSFRRYFHWLKQLHWVAKTDESEPSSMQEVTGNHPDTSPRYLYRLTTEGLAASDEDWSHPQKMLYEEIKGIPTSEYFKQMGQGHKYRRKKKRERFLRPFTLGQFIRAYLMGEGIEDAPAIDPAIGDYTEHIFYYYKEALRYAYAKDATAQENIQRIANKKEPYTPEEYDKRLEWHRERIPYKLHRARSISFFRYFHYLKQLGFVEPTGREEQSYIQTITASGNPPPCRYYRLSGKGKTAPMHEWYRPQLTLYPEFTKEYFAQKNTERRQRVKRVKNTS